MKRIIMLALLASMLSGCYDRDAGKKAFEWSSDFCGGKEKIASFSDWGNYSYSVKCLDGRWAAVP
jgi:hypothetical protein